MNLPAKPRGYVKRALRLLILAGVGFYGVVCALIFIFQRNLLYVPTVYTAGQVSQQAQAAGLDRWTNTTGQHIGMKRLAAPRLAEGIVLIFYGNGGSATGCAHYVDEIQKVAPLDVYILEYPGYQDRPEKPTQESILNAANEGLQLLPTNQPIYLVGESLGTGVASFLAEQFPERVKGIILLSPYDRLANIAQSQYPWLPARWLLLDQFPSDHFLKSYHGSVGIMLDGRDTIVPEHFGQRLYDGYAGAKKLWRYPESGHIQIGEVPENFWRTVVQFWQTDKKLT